jgi:superfamily II DNA or RNA helicase
MKIDSTIELDVEELTREQRDKLLRTLTFIDADDIEVQAYDYYHGEGRLRIPRGVWSSLPAGLEVSDMRCLPSMPTLVYGKTLNAPDYGGQIEAVAAMFKHEQGQVIAPPGRGKTEIALAFAAAAKTRTLVVVHTNALFKQWVDRMEDSVPDVVPGKIQGQTCQVGHITIAMAQTLRKYIRSGGKFWRQFGCLILDEAHHAAAETWSWLCNVCPAYYRFGITASEKRSDGRQALVKFNVGPVIAKMRFESQVPMIVKPIKTGFRTKYNGSQYTQIIRELIRNEARNAKIAGLVAREIHAGTSTLVLSRQIKHLELIYDALPADLKPHAMIVTGRLPRGKQHAITENLRNGTLRCILGTQLFEEGVDIPRLNRIILAFPGTEITALQKVGRGSRKFDGKTETIIYDMLDDLVRVLAKQYIRRRSWYKSVGIKVASNQKGKVNANAYAKAQDQVQRQGKARRIFSVSRPRRG